MQDTFLGLPTGTSSIANPASPARMVSTLPRNCLQCSLAVPVTPALTVTSLPPPARQDSPASTPTVFQTNARARTATVRFVVAARKGQSASLELLLGRRAVSSRERPALPQPARTRAHVPFSLPLALAFALAGGLKGGGGNNGGGGGGGGYTPAPANYVEMFTHAAIKHGYKLKADKSGHPPTDQQQRSLQTGDDEQQASKRFNLLDKGESFAAKLLRNSAAEEGYE